VPNISTDPNDGIGRWTEADFVSALCDGTAPGGRQLYPAFPTRFALSHPAVGTILIGVASPQHFEDALSAVQKGPLPPAALERLKALQQKFPRKTSEHIDRKERARSQRIQSYINRGSVFGPIFLVNECNRRLGGFNSATGSQCSFSQQ
jgi:hypothetical protein